MSELFLMIVNRSISAGWLVLAVLLLRFVFRKAPRWIHVLLWSFVAVRLLLPFSVESALSLIPSAETISLHIMTDKTPAVHTGIPALNSVINPVIGSSLAPAPGDSANPLQIWIPTLSMIWGIGVILLLLYAAVSYWHLRRNVREAVLLRDNLFQSENVGSPFVLGIIRPKIYLPYILQTAGISSGVPVKAPGRRSAVGCTTNLTDVQYKLDGQMLDHVAAHEQAHIRRRDHWWKPLGFLLLTIHWFNPLMWLAYVLLCRDIELACDEKVIKALDNGQRADYTQTLVACGVSRSLISACPLAFGEIGVRERVKSVMNYKKPAFWIIALAIIACAAVAVFFLTDPVDGDTPDAESSAQNGEPSDYTGKALLADGTVAGKTYLYENEGILGDFSLTLYEDSTFFYSEGMASSYMGMGTWTQDGDIITLTDNEMAGYIRINHFKIDGGDLVFLAEDSSNFIYVKVQNGERFTCTGKAPRADGSAGVPEEMGTKRKLTLEDVVSLSQKGYDLSWDDFEEYSCYETGSGLYIRVYEINGLFELRIGGGSLGSDPMYIYLALADDSGTCIDIREGGVAEFMAKDHSDTLLASAINTAILDGHKPFGPDGLFHCANFVLLKKEELCIDSEPPTPMQVTAYGIALHQAYSLSGNSLQEAEGSHIPTAITFEVIDGRYERKEYWIPRDGSYYAADVRDKFPDDIEEEALDTQKYILAQIQNCYNQAIQYCGIDTDAAVEGLFKAIESSPAASSGPADYIHAHPIEYRELTYYGDYALQYIFARFLEGGQTGLRGHLMRAVLNELAPEAQLNLDAATGQEYFDEWKASAIRASEQHDMEWIKENQPAISLLLQIIKE